MHSWNQRGCLEYRFGDPRPRISCFFFVFVVDHLKIEVVLARSETSADVNDHSELSFRPAGLRSQAGGGEGCQRLAFGGFSF